MESKVRQLCIIQGVTLRVKRLSSIMGLIFQMTVFVLGLSWQAMDSPDKFGLSPLMISG